VGDGATTATAAPEKKGVTRRRKKRGHSLVVRMGSGEFVMRIIGK
jgi:hypothetical protein